MKTLKEITKDKAFDLAEKESFPGFVEPMLATLTDDYFDDHEWIYERKLDGERCLVCIEEGKVSIYSRNEKELNNTYPELVDALDGEDYPNGILDGEIVAFDGNVTSFNKLQNRMKLKDPEEARASGVKVYLYLFDIIYYQNYSLSKLPLRQRKQILKEAINWADPIRFVSHRNEEGKDYHEEACQKGWEGIIAKDGNSGYVHSRSKKWLKYRFLKHLKNLFYGFLNNLQGNFWKVLNFSFSISFDPKDTAWPVFPGNIPGLFQGIFFLIKTHDKFIVVVQYLPLFSFRLPLNTIRPFL